MTIAIHLTEISTFEWSGNEKSVTKPPFLEASSRRVAILGTVHAGELGPRGKLGPRQQLAQ